MVVDILALWNIFVFRVRDSCLQQMYMLYIFCVQTSQNAGCFTIRINILHSIHSLWIKKLWMSENGMICGFWGF